MHSHVVTTLGELGQCALGRKGTHCLISALQLVSVDLSSQQIGMMAVETKRLRTMQEPSHLERLLEAYITRSNLIPDDSYQIRDPNSVVTPLRRIALRAVEDGRVWSCWAHGAHLWLFTAEMSLPLSRERGTPVLSVHRYSEEGELMDAGPWLLDSDGVWRRCIE